MPKKPFSFYLIRHTAVKSKGICYGFTDMDLADSYLSEKREVIANLVRLDIPKSEIKIWSSPLKRCLILAKDISEEYLFHSEPSSKSSIRTDKNLREMNFGEWENKKWNEIDQDSLKKWTDNFVSEPTPNGESFELFYERVVKKWKEITAPENSAPSNLIIAHSGVIRSILCFALDIPLQKAFSLSLPYGSVSCITVHATHHQVEFISA